MSTGKRVAPELPEDDRLKRQDEAHRLWSRGWSHRAIAAEMKLDIQQVHRALKQAAQRIREQKGDEHLAELADRITEAAWQDVAESWRVSSIEPVETEKVDEWTGGIIKTRVLAPDYKALALERGNRVKLLGLVMKATGIDPARAAELELRRQAQQQTMDLEQRKAEAQAAASAKSGDLLQQLADGLLCGPPTGPVPMPE